MERTGLKFLVATMAALLLCSATNAQQAPPPPPPPRPPPQLAPPPQSPAQNGQQMPRRHTKGDGMADKIAWYKTVGVGKVDEVTDPVITGYGNDALWELVQHPAPESPRQ